MRDERVVLNRLKLDQQRKMLLRRGEVPTRSVSLEPAKPLSFSPFGISGAPSQDTTPLLSDEAAGAVLGIPAPQRVSMLGHNGFRSVARNSKWNYRGYTIIDNREVQHESGIERNAVAVFRTWHYVKEIYSQRPRVEYADGDGVIHDYVFDYLLILNDDTRVAVSVKAERARAEEKALLEHIVSVPQSEFDNVFLMTDGIATRAAAFNARLILWARDLVTEAVVDQAREMVRQSGSKFFFWQLFDNGIPHHLRRAAIVRLIDLGEIAPTEPHKRIRDYSLLEKVDDHAHVRTWAKAAQTQDGHKSTTTS
jgi:hypothetical protein